MPYRDDLSNPNEISHSTASQWILQRYGVDPTLAIIAGGHHGKPPGKQISKIGAYRDNTGETSDEWITAQKCFFDYAVNESGLEAEKIPSIKILSSGQILLMGLITMADWIASNEKLFPLGTRSDYDKETLEKRVSVAWTSFHPPSRWRPTLSENACSLYENRFGFKPRLFQECAIDVASRIPDSGLIIIEAPMGEGKTEAALEVAEILANRFGLTGIFFALPTQATADGLCPRIRSWLMKADIG